MYYFFSDVHLGLFSREKDILIENKLLDFLDSIKINCNFGLTIFI